LRCGCQREGDIGAIEISTRAKEPLEASHGRPFGALRVEVKSRHARPGRSEAAGTRGVEGRSIVGRISDVGGVWLGQELPGAVDVAVAVAVTVAVVVAMVEAVGAVPVHAGSCEPGGDGRSCELRGGSASSEEDPAGDRGSGGGGSERRRRLKCVREEENGEEGNERIGWGY